MLTITVVLSGLESRAAEPPAGLLRKIAAQEAANEAARKNYTYRQSVSVEELDGHGLVTGSYQEVRDVVFSPDRGRYENVVQPAKNTLKGIQLTNEDFADLREVQPFLLTTEEVPFYEGKFRGEETINGVPCFVELIEPRQIIAGKRYFKGLIWVRQSDLSVIRSEGQAVPQIQTRTKENLFPKFRTDRIQVDGKWMFPVATNANDTLNFKSVGPIQIRVRIQYSNYRRFGAETTVKFEDQPGVTPPQLK